MAFGFRKKFSSWKKRYLGSQSGQTAIIFALALIPMAAILGFAVDFQSTTRQKSRAQMMLDAAVLSGARERQAGQTEAQVRKHVRDYVGAMIAEEGGGMTCKPANVSFSTTTSDINASMECSQATTVSNVVGRSKIDFSTAATVTYGVGLLDVAFVLDVSGSMQGQKLTDLKAGVKDAVDILIPDGTPSDNDDVRIGMVTYATSVNAGPYFKKVTGLSGTSRAETYTTTGWVCARYFFGFCLKWEEQTVEEDYWVNNSCVHERPGDDAFTDAKPEGHNRRLTPGSILMDGDGNPYAIDCPASTPLPLTNSRFSITSYVNSLVAGGSTAGHQGIAWGWYLIAWDWKSVWPSASRPLEYDEPDSTKVIILMTDGEFNREYHRQFDGETLDSFDQAKKLCDAAKAKDVVIYTIAFQAPEEGEAILDYCATKPALAFVASNGQQLRDAYKTIAGSVSDLRIKN